MAVPIPRNETRRLAALKRFQILDTAPERAFDDLALLASSICKTPIALMTLVDDGRQWFKARLGLEVSETPREQAFCAYTILSKEVMVIEDATQDERFAENRLVTSDPHIRFYAGAPIIDREGNALGSLCVIDRVPNRITEEQRAALQALSRLVTVLLETRHSAGELATVLAEAKILQGLLPICAHCKGIRNDRGYWDSVENYVGTHTEAEFSHSICPDCMRRELPELYDELKTSGKL